jgi:hypothetical protein
LKNQIKAESTIISQTWKLIRLLSGHYQATLPLPGLFYALAQEHRLFFFRFLDESQEIKKTSENLQRNATCTDIKKSIQSENRKLSEVEDVFKNPFERDKSPYTYGFVKICNFEADKNPEFQKEYRLLISARKHLTTEILSKHPEVIRKNSQKREMRGRKYGV